MTANKFQIRTAYREKRRQILPAQREMAAAFAAKELMQQAVFLQSEHIACYLATPFEFETLPIIEAIWQAKKYCYLPVLDSGEHPALTFVRYQYGDALHLNRYSILEPVKVSERIASADLDLALVPLIAFDHAGHRLGAGGGYYDRSFAFLRALAVRKPQLMGLAYAIQEKENLPSDPWDIHLDAVLTEKAVHYFKR